MFKKDPSPTLTLSIMLGVVAMMMQAMVANYIIDALNQKYHAELRRLQIQIAQDLAAQLSRAQASNDDLNALSALRSARLNHPQLIEALIFDNAGKILLHTDSGEMGKTLDVPKGPRLSAPFIRHFTEQKRKVMSIQLPIPDRDNGYCRVNFDEAQFAQEANSLSLQTYSLITATSVVLGFLCWMRLKRYKVVDPHQRVALPKEAPSAAPVTPLADALLAEMPHATLAIDHENKIVAVNTLALELLNCRQEELEGQHMLSAPLPGGLLDFYQAALKQPGHGLEEKIVLVPKAPALTAYAAFSPAAENWTVMLVTLR